MKALIYKGPRNVQITEVPDPKIEKPTDVLVKITSTNICGSDLHMYEGRTDVEEGKVLGQRPQGTPRGGARGITSHTLANEARSIAPRVW